MKNRIPQNHWLLNRAAAHRGFYGGDIPENSIAAFKRAIENNYPIETDIQLSKDGVLFCFHDNNVKRLTSLDKLIWEMTAPEIKELKLAQTEERVPTFEEFLNLVGGKVPLLIEIKSQPKNEEATKKVLALLEGYKGEYVIQSFDPRVVKYVRLLRPDIIRGQLIDRDRHKDIKYITYFLLSHALLNFMSKPDFINFNKAYLPLSKRMRRGKRVLCWTVSSEEEEKKALPYVSSYVFENITPIKREQVK